MKDFKQVLRQIHVFAGLNDEELDQLAAIVLFRPYRKGMFIFMESEPGDALFFVQQGRIKLSKTLADGREHILHFVGEGQIFAEVLLFDDGPYPATAEVMTDATIGIIRNKDLDIFLRTHPDTSLKILKVMSRRLRKAQMQIRDLALKDTFGRLMSTLVKLAGEYGKETEEGLLIDISLSQQELANMIGASRETVSRSLNDLKKSNVIDFNRQCILIKNMEKLKMWME
ncbi:Crp/Fnr family transcriptional regulator [Metallumcola ferriviriculae]|uniref:Crp/Fnr family transcriptional regulator n=1 Tax=Metallumcola ferriviriculae TaxID=3039180 RepID=A0AAU0UPN9_9FIRM|nr:Crp/Fnr family transcriptional regulator [Desulfitibacteraceae bacterium MK1]